MGAIVGDFEYPTDEVSQDEKNPKPALSD